MEQNEESKSEKEGKAEKLFRDFGKKLDHFFSEAKVAGKRAEGDLKKTFDDLKASAEKMKNNPETKERWKEVEASLKKAGQELENAVKAAFKKKNTDNS